MATPGAVVSSVNQTIVTALNIHEPQALNKLVLKAPSEFESIAAIMEICLPGLRVKTVNSVGAWLGMVVLSYSGKAT